MSRKSFFHSAMTDRRVHGLTLVNTNEGFCHPGPMHGLGTKLHIGHACVSLFFKRIIQHVLRSELLQKRPKLIGHMPPRSWRSWSSPAPQLSQKRSNKKDSTNECRHFILALKRKSSSSLFMLRIQPDPIFPAPRVQETTVGQPLRLNLLAGAGSRTASIIRAGFANLIWHQKTSDVQRICCNT
jgi:hypothetical protein